jgi:hypothetical protein
VQGALVLCALLKSEDSMINDVFEQSCRSARGGAF